MIKKAVQTKEGWLGVGTNGVHIPGVETLAELWRWTAQNRPLANAFHYLQTGRWISISTDEFDQQMRALAVALSKLGLKPGDTMGIIATPSPWWLMMDLAVQSIGAISVPLFPNLSIESFEYEIEKSNTRFLFIDNDRDLSDEIRLTLSKFEKVVAIRTTRSGYSPTYFFDLIDEGVALLNSDPELYNKTVPQIDPDDVATIIFTSGSSGVPKGVQLTHRNILAQMRSIWGRFPLRHREDIALSGLPLAHSFERTVVYFYLSCGLQIYFADDTRRLGELLQGVKPHILTAVPRLLEKVLEKMRANADASKPITRKIINSAINYAASKPPKIVSDSTPTTYILSPLHWIYDKVVYKKMREALGGNLTLMISGGAKLAPQTQNFFLNIGLPLAEGYGLTEASPVVAVNEPWDNSFGSIGYPLPDIEVKLDDQGGLLVKGDNVMKGFLNAPEQTAEMIDSDGWLHTGDKATIDEEGRITIVGRLKELFKTSNGKYVSPVPIEQRLTEHPLIDMAMVIADGRKYPTALLFPSDDKLQMWLKSKGLPTTDLESFWKQESALKEVSDLIDEVNASISSWERIVRWKLLTELPTIDNGGLTPTLKIRRAVIETKYAALINSFYQE